MSIIISEAGDEFKIVFEYSKEKVEKLKTLEKYRWSNEDKAWFVKKSFNNLNQLKLIFEIRDIIMQDEIESSNSKGVNSITQELKLKGYSHKTIKSYVGHVKRFEVYIQKSLYEIDMDDIKRYILYLVDEKNASHSFVNQAISAIKFLWSSVLHRLDYSIELLARPKKERKLPNVLSTNEVIEILNASNNEKHKTILYMIYSAGLRVSEVVRLQLDDIDSNRMLVRIQQGKGRKDRYTILSEITLKQLRKYYILYKPEQWLFPGGNGKSYLTERTVQKIFEDACNKAKIKRKVTVI